VTAQRWAGSLLLAGSLGIRPPLSRSGDKRGGEGDSERDLEEAIGVHEEI
jgi:hypothetical protein